MDSDLFENMEKALGDGVIEDDLFANMDAALIADDPFDDIAPLQTDRQLQQPLIYARRVAKREMIANLKRRTLSELIPQLPPRDTDIHIVSNGEGREGRMGATLSASGFDFGSFIPVLVSLLGNVGCHCYCSTWVMNGDHAREFVAMLDDRRLDTLFVASDPFFKNKPTTAPIAASLIAGLQRHAPRARFLAWKNHAKILCVANPDESQCATVTGSANLTAVQRAENYVLSSDPGLYQFYRDEFFGSMMNG